MFPVSIKRFFFLKILDCYVTLCVLTIDSFFQPAFSAFSTMETRRSTWKYFTAGFFFPEAFLVFLLSREV